MQKKKLNVGDEFDFKGRFTSSSTEEYVADNFRHIGKGDVVWSIKAKSGTDIKAINAAEKEVLLRMNTKYKLKSITPKEGDSRILIYEIIEQ